MLKALSKRRENEILISIYGEISDLIEDGKVFRQDVQEKLEQYVSFYGVGEPDEFFVGRVRDFFKPF